MTTPPPGLESLSESAPESGPRESALERHPVVLGLVALLGVAVAVGVIAGAGVLFASRSLGVGEDAAGGGSQAQGQETIFIPELTDDGEAIGSSITLLPEPDGGPRAQESPSQEPSTPEESTDPAEEPGISLSAGQTAVAPMERIDLTGVYRGGEGAVLNVQQFSGGAWEDFPVTIPVSGSTFVTYIQTGQVGKNRFRVIDTDSGEISNEVVVQIG